MELERFMRRIGLPGEARAVVIDHPYPAAGVPAMEGTLLHGCRGLSGGVETAGGQARLGAVAHRRCGGGVRALSGAGNTGKGLLGDLFRYRHMV